MRSLERGKISILGREFEVFGYSDDTVYQDIKSRGSFHEFNLAHLENLIGPDDICLDLGANVGMITLALSVLAPNGHVYAFEGSPETTLALHETIRFNGLANVSVANVVVGRPSEAVKFFDMPDVRSSSHYLPVDVTRQVTAVWQNTSQVLATKSVDQLVDDLNLQRLDFIKIDVEGAELDTLQGASNTFQKFSPLVLMEFNSYAFMHLREIAPRNALRQIFDTFHEVYYFKDRTGGLTRLDNTERDRERFLHDNLFHGFVDDLLCVFNETRLARSGALKREIRLVELEKQAVQREVILAEQAARVVELEGVASNSSAMLAEQDAKMSKSQALLAEREAKLTELEAVLAEREAKLTELEAVLAEREAKLTELEAVLAEREVALGEMKRVVSEKGALAKALLNSRSWRITAPLRKVATWLR
jgi:FkbM family methyltransferase